MVAEVKCVWAFGVAWSEAGLGEGALFTAPRQRDAAQGGARGRGDGGRRGHGPAALRAAGGARLYMT